MNSLGDNTIHVFWTGDNEITSNRVNCLNQLKHVSECNVVLVTADTLASYVLPSEPLHPAYEYLSFTHRADYLRAYFMNFYGGGYSDIKSTYGSWRDSFETLKSDESKWMVGYPEIPGGVAYAPLSDKHAELIGNGAYICKPQTPITKEWYSSMIELLDEKLQALKMFPASFPQDCAEVSRYPIEWNEMCGRIAQRVMYKYKERLLHTVPMPSFNNYR